MSTRRRYEDPTHTRTLQNQYARRLRGGFTTINTVIREFVEEDDGLEITASELTAEPPHPNRRNFEFTTDPQKARAFEQWLREAQASDVLTVIDRDENRYVRHAYESGLRSANSELADQGVDASADLASLTNQPVHTTTLQQLYTRNYDLLEDITDDVADEVRETMTESFSEGVNPRVMGRRIRDRVDSVGITRATTLARTEVLNTHNEAYLNRAETVLGPDAEVQVEAEILSAGDRRVCPECEPMDGVRMTIEEARESGPPFHPQCRCTYRTRFASQ